VLSMDTIGPTGTCQLMQSNIGCYGESQFAMTCCGKNQSLLMSISHVRETTAQ